MLETEQDIDTVTTTHREQPGRAGTRKMFTVGITQYL